VAAGQNRPALPPRTPGGPPIPRPSRGRTPSSCASTASTTRPGLGQPHQRPDGAPPVVPVLLPEPGPSLLSPHTVRKL